MENPTITNLVSVNEIGADKAAALAVTYERLSLAALKDKAALVGIAGEPGWKKRDYVVALVRNTADVTIVHRAPVPLWAAR